MLNVGWGGLLRSIFFFYRVWYWPFSFRFDCQASFQPNVKNDPGDRRSQPVNTRRRIPYALILKKGPVLPCPLPIVGSNKPSLSFCSRLGFPFIGFCSCRFSFLLYSLQQSRRRIFAADQIRIGSAPFGGKFASECFGQNGLGELVNPF